MNTFSWRNSLNNFSYLSCLLIVITLSSCGGSDGEKAEPPKVAKLEAKVAYVGETVVLDGSDSENINSAEISYLWSVGSTAEENEYQLENDSSAISTFIAHKVGNYQVELTISDGNLLNTATTHIEVINRKPIANAGDNQTVAFPSEICLDGSKSSDSDNQEISYRWSSNELRIEDVLVSGSLESSSLCVELLNKGEYEFVLTVTDSLGESSEDLVMINADNVAPIACAGEDINERQTGSEIQLNAACSMDANGDILTYRWEVIETPEDANLKIEQENSVNPTIKLSTKGTYKVRVTVSDGIHESADEVTIGVKNSKPSFISGCEDLVIHLGEQPAISCPAVDDDNDNLSYRWSIISSPSLANAELSTRSGIYTNFTTDVEGDYNIQVIANDGEIDSEPRVISVFVGAKNKNPISDAGKDQIAEVGDLVELDGTASTDSDGIIAEFQWSLESKPTGSSVIIEDSSQSTAYFVPDIAGTYVVNLAVKDEDGAENKISSEDKKSSTIIHVSSKNTPPVAIIGENKISACIGENSTLDGSKSYDLDGDQITYDWALTTKPKNSNYSLNGENSDSLILSTATPGDYRFQLTVNDGLLFSDADTVDITVKDCDQDEDGLPSSIELAIGLNPNLEDSNSDGVTDGKEDFDLDVINLILTSQNIAPDIESHLLELKNEVNQSNPENKQSVIKVTGARIGCLDIQINDNLTKFVASKCDGKPNCSYKAPTEDQYKRWGVKAKTRTFCTQGMEIIYTCTDLAGNQRSFVRGDAWNNPPAFLTCAKGPQKSGFDVKKHGFMFSNYFTNNFISGLDVRTSGLCGGMTLAALDYYHSTVSIPTQSYRPAEGTKLRKYLYDRQVKTLQDNLDKWGELNTNPLGWRDEEFFNWGLQGFGGGHLQKLMEAIDSKKPVPLGLASCGDGGCAENHYVLAIGYKLGRYRGDLENHKGDLEIYVLDPNSPNKEKILVPDVANKRYHYKSRKTKYWRTYFIDQKYRATNPPSDPEPNKKLLIQLYTGADDLKGKRDNLSIDVFYRQNKLSFDNVNNGKRWINETNNTIALEMPQDVDWTQIDKVELRTSFSGGLGGDNWNLNKIRILSSDGKGKNAKVKVLYENYGTPWMRFTGDKKRRSISLH